MTSPAELERQRAARKADREARQRSKNRTPPRFFVVVRRSSPPCNLTELANSSPPQTDHPNRTILLLIRGTLSIDDVATDLACEPSAFDPSLYWDEECESQSFLVHGGIMEMTLAMGGHDGPVTRAVAKALKRNPSYGKWLLHLGVRSARAHLSRLAELTVVGHSLGAGVASLLALTWADPTSALTTSKSGLPAGKRVQVYGFATPCVSIAVFRRYRELTYTLADA